ncbi:MAG TPA: hypothetical protein PLV68_07045, partial [Ilumatobacteraceae bacterium]|nr:hypothetical protein [Ilumatobacteraceae bacterium]
PSASQPTPAIRVDVLGVYVPASGAVSAGRLVPLPTAVRVLDTRVSGNIVSGGTTRTVPLPASIPTTASAVVVNVTVTAATGRGYWTVGPAGVLRSDTSNLNVFAGETAAAQAVIGLTSLRAIEVFSQSGGHLIVDVAGWYTGATDPADTDGLFVPIPVTRALDTRDAFPLDPLSVTAVDVADAAPAQAVACNITMVAGRAPGYVTAMPAGTPRPLASHVNASRTGQVVANHAIVRCSDVGVALFCQQGGHLVVDVAGWFTGTPVAVERTTIDLAQAAGGLPTASVASVALGAVVAAAPGNRIAVVDPAGSVSFLSATGAVVSSASIAIPAGFSFAACAVGPDDVLYLFDRDGASPAIRVFARSGSTYRQIATNATSQGHRALAATRHGIGVIDEPGSLIQPYLSVGGAPSGRTLDIDQMHWSMRPNGEMTVARGEHFRVVRYTANQCLLDTSNSGECITVGLGSGHDVVLTDPIDAQQRRLTWLGTDGRTAAWQGRYTYCGAIAAGLVVTADGPDAQQITVVAP